MKILLLSLTLTLTLFNSQGSIVSFKNGIDFSGENYHYSILQSSIEKGGFLNAETEIKEGFIGHSDSVAFSLLIEDIWTEPAWIGPESLDLQNHFILQARVPTNGTLVKKIAVIELSSIDVFLDQETIKNGQRYYRPIVDNSEFEVTLGIGNLKEGESLEDEIEITCDHEKDFGAPIPEPNTTIMFIAGMCFILIFKRRV